MITKIVALNKIKLEKLKQELVSTLSRLVNPIICKGSGDEVIIKLEPLNLRKIISINEEILAIKSEVSGESSPHSEFANKMNQSFLEEYKKLRMQESVGIFVPGPLDPKGK